VFEVCYWFDFIIVCCFVQAIVDVIVLNEELGHVVVKEAFEEFDIVYRKIRCKGEVKS